MDRQVSTSSRPLDIAVVAATIVVGAALIANREHVAVELWVALAVSVIVLPLRRRAPLPVLGVVLAAMVAGNAEAVTIVPALLMLATIARRPDHSAMVGATLAAAVAVVVVGPVHGSSQRLSDVAFRLIAIALAVAIGLYMRARADYVAGLRERAERLQREHELLAGQAVAEERVRIARELHDVVAHNVSLMVVQAQALAATGGDAEQRAGLNRVAGLGREALSEMHRMLDVLRLENGRVADRAPQPGVADLDKLVAQTSEAGVQADLTVEGEPRALPAGVELSAYRIVQEALTNVVRHAGASHVDVALEYARDALLVTVTDDGRGPSPASGNGGHGLVGMRERVALFGGGMQAGARSDGPGYRVRVTLPTR